MVSFFCEKNFNANYTFECYKFCSIFLKQRGLQLHFYLPHFCYSPSSSFSLSLSLSCFHLSNKKRTASKADLVCFHKNANNISYLAFTWTCTFCNILSFAIIWVNKEIVFIILLDSIEDQLVVALVVERHSWGGGEELFS